MSDWAGEMAQQLRSRDNRNIIGTVVGIVVSPPPELVISILDGAVMIRDCYILNRSLSGYERIFNLPLESLKGEISIKGYKTTRENKELESSIKDYQITEFEVLNKKMIYEDTLKAGDKVMLVSSQDNQTYFCVGKVTRMGGV